MDLKSCSAADGEFQVDLVRSRAHPKGFVRVRPGRVPVHAWVSLESGILAGTGASLFVWALQQGHLVVLNSFGVSLAFALIASWFDRSRIYSSLERGRIALVWLGLIAGKSVIGFLLFPEKGAWSMLYLPWEILYIRNVLDRFHSLRRVGSISDDCEIGRHTSVAFVELNGSDFSCCDLRNSEFLHVRFNSVNFSDARLEESRFIECSFENCNLKSAELSRTTWIRPKVSSTNFRRVYLYGARFRGGTITTSDMSEALLTATKFASILPVRYVRFGSVKLTDAIYDDDTRWPPQVDPALLGAGKATR